MSKGLLRTVCILGLACLSAVPTRGRETAETAEAACSADLPAVDLFADEPELSREFIRMASWNVRHLKLTDESRRYLGGRMAAAEHALTATFARAIRDLRLDLVLLVEVQPQPERDSLVELVVHLNRSGGVWRSLRTHIEYDQPDDPFGNLQFGLVWNASRGVYVHGAEAQLLEPLRQPRDAGGTLLSRDQRTPWLVPVSVDGFRGGSGLEGKTHGTPVWRRLEFDLLALHFKSGGGTPQAAEVEAVCGFLMAHQNAMAPRHLIVAGDWNIRPDEDLQGRGRPRLRKLTIPHAGSSRLRLLTVGDLPPSLDEWAEIDRRLGSGTSSARWKFLRGVLPASHLDASSDGFDSLLDHLAISRTLDELFDHPVRVMRADGRTDMRPGIEIPRPQVTREQYLCFTDHLPVILTLRIDMPPARRSVAPLRIVAVEPNPVGDEEEDEAVLLRNVSAETVPLEGWRLRNAVGEEWRIGPPDQFGNAPLRLSRGRTVAIRRQSRPMGLSNSGDTIYLLDPRGEIADSRRFGEARTGQVIWFD